MTFPALQNGSLTGDYRATLGESPVWCTRSESVIWMDIAEQRMLRCWPDQADRMEIRDLPFICSAALLTEDPERFLLVTQQGVMLYDYLHETFQVLCNWPETPATRPNEAAVAPDGSLWFSTMDITARKALGSWYRFAAGDKQPVKMLGGQHVPNTLVWHDNHAWFGDTFAHRFYRSPARRISAERLTSWPLGDAVFADGSALTRCAKLINARWGASCLAVYQLSGSGPELLTTLPLPVLQPSSCAFGGKNLQDLYITSARDGLKNPSAAQGALLRYQTPYSGQRATLFTL
ncbi:SMP-30/gluconolactonase/LRE family protein [Rahnella woolbedingensis]|uniref:SMP-30/gluconolactonase/LRE family protein n=1 Tax=Rahnella woolbedingensis TaxID=1510574 RepID=A0A419NB66_9GAMM|nr:SMP-30/gluconolactonase/LRE family protein [Rahnella woolbedingensis]RJT45422.1 SMP-30/gluconolactonase/LRE family protein [Rahnella woolbedingensis]